ncbi:hypothetical protein FA95DRAFT_87403 [Auriscalpium vulgare]|uniref:Uncharacterized protein n=1 Tax=Auriscalpium vulgare TaxID=40419 RepID=A0ACB8RQ31_9AGAM|nr:hypothetical protein FA95DRAFT_87403 [Auriscalpium vulgare]
MTVLSASASSGACASWRISSSASTCLWSVGQHPLLCSSPSRTSHGRRERQIRSEHRGHDTRRALKESSVPPPHTGIGSLSSLISSLEGKPLFTNLTPTSPYLASLECAVAHDPALDANLRAPIAHARTDDAALSGLHDALLAADPRRFRGITATGSGFGGVKVNALPESAWAVDDHSIAD